MVLLCIYKKFKFQLALHLHHLFHAYITNNRLPQSWGEGKIIVLPKSSSGLSLVQSYRPISLMNVDYKILAFVLASKLNKTLELYIHSNQSGFLRGRQLNDNRRTVMNIINHIQTGKIPSVLYFLDTEKEFDRVE